MQKIFLKIEMFQRVASRKLSKGLHAKLRILPEPQILEAGKATSGGHHDEASVGYQNYDIARINGCTARSS